MRRLDPVNPKLPALAGLHQQILKKYDKGRAPRKRESAYTEQSHRQDTHHLCQRTVHARSGNDTPQVRAALMQKVCGDEDMFALGTSVARVVQMASSDDQGTHDLAYYVLSDVALTQRILRLSNTATLPHRLRHLVTTISRAISLLGFDNVKTTALAMLLVDALANSAHAQSVRVELEAALCASLVGREMARHSFYQGAEEASIGALFKNLGAAAGRLPRARALPRNQCADRQRQAHAWRRPRR